ncbi:MAG: N-acetylmuramoyl-L-alanine amidase, partial [Spirochaetia bacterium]|nr:N-acetylmuramoyl-L-alanine amidase [Spirochaetia bacterium]
HKPGPYALKYADFKPEGLKFWDREKSRTESWRREDGPAGYGGDNHYAGDELLRFVQYGARRMSPELAKPGAVGDILAPWSTTYSLPTFVNAICAYLEIGHINVDRDRRLVTTHREIVAKSIAAGIYSLFTGMRLKPGAGPYAPRGKAVDFQKYENLPDGNYFDSVL